MLIFTYQLLMIAFSLSFAALPFGLESDFEDDRDSDDDDYWKWKLGRIAECVSVTITISIRHC